MTSIHKWWHDLKQRALSVPLSGKGRKAFESAFIPGHQQVPFADLPTMLIDPRLLRQALLDLGAEVRLRWKRVATET